MELIQLRRPVTGKIFKKAKSPLKASTTARINLGRTGTSVPLKELLAFKLAHAHARDAVYSTLNVPFLQLKLQTLLLSSNYIKSKASDRTEYLKRPDLGRKLDPESKKTLKATFSEPTDIAIILADGLSATAINYHAIPVLELLIPRLKATGYTVAPIQVAEQARVAIADEIGVALKAKLTIILIGERPGLSSPDSLGAYLTYNPKNNLSDESRNCVSNIRAEGLAYKAATDKIFYLVQQSFFRRLSGIQLKDELDLLER